MANDGAIDELEQIDPGIEPETVEYWKARARQWQRRCQRSEREKTEIIALLNGQRRALVDAHDEKLAVIRGDTLGGRSGAPRGHRNA